MYDKIFFGMDCLSGLSIVKRCRLVGGRREDILMGLEKED